MELSCFTDFIIMRLPFCIIGLIKCWNSITIYLKLSNSNNFFYNIYVTLLINLIKTLILVLLVHGTTQLGYLFVIIKIFVKHLTVDFTLLINSKYFFTSANLNVL